MDFIREFIVENWQWLCSVVFAIAIFILQLLRKRPFEVVDTLKQIISYNVAEWINSAESFYGPGKGTEKKLAVIKMCEEFCKVNGFDFTNFYRDWLSSVIEDFLSTPTKNRKGD